MTPTSGCAIRADMSACFLVYSRLVFSFAARHAISRAQFIIAIISLITGAAMWLAPAFGMTIDASGLVAMLHSPSFYAMLVGSVFILNLIYAQYRVWVDERTTRIKAESQVAELSARLQPPPNTDHNALSIEFTRDDLHEIVETLPAGTIRRRLKISVLNRGNGWLSNCRLSVEQTTPSIYDNAIELLSGFTLQSGEPRYAEFLYFDEKFPDGHAGSKVLLAHHSRGSYVEIGFSTTQPTIFKLKATSNEARESTAFFRAFVENWRLQMERI
jgi:hypothetical protein